MRAFALATRDLGSQGGAKRTLPFPSPCVGQLKRLLIRNPASL
jgi:hypothetical protein